MGNMRFKVGDRVRIKSLDWYKENMDEHGRINYGYAQFIPDMSLYCGEVLTICDIEEDFSYYHMKECVYVFMDEMIECKVEDENNHLTEIVVDTVRESNDRYRIVIDPRFDIEVDEGEYYAVRRKKEYPKTYEECSLINGYEDRIRLKIIGEFTRLINARNAYWKLYGEEMGLGKPWEPRWNDNYQKKWIINCYQDEINLTNGPNVHFVLAFPTKEMRDAFYENFKEEIESCKKLL